MDAKNIVKIISLICVAFMLLSSYLVFAEVITSAMNKTLLLVLTIIWFATAPFWMQDKSEAESDA